MTDWKEGEKGFAALPWGVCNPFFLLMRLRFIDASPKVMHRSVISEAEASPLVKRRPIPGDTGSVFHPERPNLSGWKTDPVFLYPRTIETQCRRLFFYGRS